MSVAHATRGAATQSGSSDRLGKLRAIFNKKPEHADKFSLRVPQEVTVRLREMKEQTGAKSLNEVINDAIIFYDVMLQERADGNLVTVTSSNGSTAIYDVFPSQD